MTITEVCKQYGLTADTLRYYERIGLLPPVHRTKSGIRDYTQEDCYWVNFIKCMRSAGLPIDVLIRYVTLFRQGDETAAERRELLVEQRRILAARITEMEQTLARLDYKIANYDETLAHMEQKLK